MLLNIKSFLFDTLPLKSPDKTFLTVEYLLTFFNFFFPLTCGIFNCKAFEYDNTSGGIRITSSVNSYENKDMIR